MPLLDFLKPLEHRSANVSNKQLADKIKEAVDEKEIELDDKVREAVDAALVEAQGWVKSGEGDSVFSNISFGDGDHVKSIFEEYDATISGGPSDKDIKTKAKESKLSEALWASSGLNVYQDPNNLQTLEKLRLQQSAALYQWINFPIARSEIENIKRYVLGRGVKIDCLAEPVLRVIRNFWKINELEDKNKQAFQMFLIDGEYFALLFDNHEGDSDFDEEQDSVLMLRSVPSFEIDDIEFDDEDRESRLSYKRLVVKGDGIEEKFYLDISYPFGDEKELQLPKPSTMDTSTIEAEAPRMMMIKYGLLYDQRGRVPLESILRWNRVAVDYLYSRARLNFLRSKIFLIETRSGKVGKVAASSNSVEAMPKGGMKLIETPDRSFRMVSPNTGADNAEIDYRMILYMIGSALSMPIHILNMNAENENYASIREAANPFAQAVQDFQDDWGSNLRKLLRYVISHAIRVKVLEPQYEIEFLPEDIIGEVKRLVNDKLKAGCDTKAVIAEAQVIIEAEKEKKVVKTLNVPVSIVFPNIIQTDPTKEADAIKVYQELGLLSKYTSRLRIGVDPDVEAARIASEKEVELELREKEFERFNNGAPSASNEAPAPSTGSEEE